MIRIQKIQLKLHKCISFIFFILLVNSYGLAEAADIQGSVKIITEDGTIKNDNSGVIIFLDSIETYNFKPISNEKASIEQVDKRFSPQILPVMTGTEVTFPNNDFIFHNVFSLSKTKPFDLGIYKQGESRSVVFDAPGLVKIYCNIHPDMIAYVLVIDNPFFTMTDEEGRFILKNVPFGKMSLRSWSPRVKAHIDQQILVNDEGIRDLNLVVLEQLNFQIKEEVISIKHKNKWGQDYPSKY